MNGYFGRFTFLTLIKKSFVLAFFKQCILLFAFAGALAAQSPVATTADTADERLAYMKAAGQTYTTTMGTNTPISFNSEPVLRFTNPVSGVVDGGLFVWQNSNNRPVAIAQFFIAPGTESLWIHEFQSLSVVPLKFDYQGRVAWAPDKAGIKYEVITKVNPPAGTPEARLTQMRQIARRFSVKDDFEAARIDELRLLSTPLVRFSDDETMDGALFAFAHGTDPELLLMVEAQKPKDGSDNELWRVACAPMTSYAITAKLDGEDHWSVPLREAPHPINAVFKNFVFPPEPTKSLLDRLLGN